MTATEELRRMLDERGVKWKSGDFIEPNAETQWGNNCYTDYPELPPYLTVSNCTPEQAIAATLGKQGYYTDHDDEGTHIMCDRCGEYIGTAEGIAATLDAGECELVYGENDYGDDGWWCQSCGGWFAASFRHTGRNNIIKPSYCQHCGRKVVEQ